MKPLLLSLMFVLAGCASPTAPAEVWTCHNLRTGEVTTHPYRDPMTDLVPPHAICSHGSPGVVTT